MHRLLPLALLAALLAAGPARAQVVAADIALLEDTDGSVYAATGGLNPMADAFLQAAACAFYDAYPDADPDVLFVVSTTRLPPMARVQSGIAIYRQTRGIGIGAINTRAKYCALNRRLKHAVRTGDFDSLPDDPHAQLKDRKELALHALSMMAHELGHYWMAYPSYDRKDGGGQQCDLRVYTPDGGTSADTRCGGLPVSSFGLHWSFFFESGGVMFGSPHIEDKGDGTFRFWNDGVYKYGPLDQYLMGLRLPEQVGPLTLIRAWSSSMTSGDYLVFPGAENEKVVDGERVDVSVQDIVNFEGARVPELDPCHWKGVLVLVYPKGKKALAEAKVPTLAVYGNAFEAYYAEATDQRGSFDLTLDGRGTGTPTCPGLPLHPPEDTGAPADEAVPPDLANSGDVPFPDDVPVAPGDAAVEEPAPADLPDRPDAAVEVPDTPDADGTVACVPGATRCNPVGNAVAQRCATDGRTWETLEDCGVAGKSCSDGACTGGSGGGCSATGVPASSPPPVLPAAALVIAALGLVARAARRRDGRA